MLISQDDLRLAARSLARAPGFTVPALVSLVLGAGLSVAILGLFEIVSLRPPVVESSIALEYVRDPGWADRWKAPMWTPGQVQAARFEDLQRTLATVAIMSLAIACLNIVILLLVRASTRSGEIALLAAVGASRRRLKRLLLAEGLLLAAAGGTGGLGLGLVFLNLLKRTWPHAVLSEGLMNADPWIVLLALGLPVLAATVLPVLALAPMLKHRDLSGMLTAGADIGSGRGALRLQDGLAVVQLGVAVLLLIGAGSLARTALSMLQPGSGALRERDTAIVELDLPPEGYSNDAQRAQLYERLLALGNGMAGVTAETLSTPGTWLSLGPIGFVAAQCGRCYRGIHYLPIMPGYVRQHAVSAGFFDTAKAQVLEGREFTADDRAGAPKVMLVNRTFAESHFEGGKPLGRKVQIGGIRSSWYTVVGIVEDLPGGGIGASSQPGPVVYLPLLQEPPLSADITLAGREIEVRSGDIAESINRLAGAEVVSEVRLMDDYHAHHAEPISWFGYVVGAIGLVTVVLGALGVYAVMSYRVSQGRREIGMRRALGARRWRVLTGTLLETVGLLAMGTALGLWATPLLLGRLDAVLAGVRLFDPVVYGGTLLVVLVAALAGGILPARQAARVEPAVALHTE